MLSPAKSLGYRNQATTTDGANLKKHRQQSTINQEFMMALHTTGVFHEYKFAKHAAMVHGRNGKSMILDCATTAV